MNDVLVIINGMFSIELKVSGAALPQSIIVTAVDRVTGLIAQSFNPLLTQEQNAEIAIAKLEIMKKELNFHEKGEKELSQGVLSR